ncbi:MAG TPA: PEGA domain-containing protein [Polyangia bacterium]
MTRPRTFSVGARLVAAFTLCAVASCASTTVIQSRPSGARIYLDGQPAGVTPYTMSDTKIVGSTTMVRLEYPGYEPTTGFISRNEEVDVLALIGGLLVLVPLLWLMDYRPLHVFELRPLGAYPGYAPPSYAPPGYAAPPPYDPYNPPPPSPAPPPAAPPPAAR